MWIRSKTFNNGGFAQITQTLLQAFVYTAIRHLVWICINVQQHGRLVVENCENYVFMWINTSNEGIWKICAKPPFLHSLDVPIKMFTNSLAVLQQKTLGRTDRIHCFQILQILLIESCLVDLFYVDKSPWFSSLKKVWIRRLDSGLMVSGIYLKFTFYSKKFSNYFFVVGGQGGAH